MAIVNGQTNSTCISADYPNVPKTTGSIYYVSSSGNDAASGTEPSTALKTIGAAIGKLSSGDTVMVGAGTYTEDGLDLDQDNTSIVCAIGTSIEPSGASTCLIISGNHCSLSGCHLKKSGQIGLQITGDDCSIDNVHVESATIAFDVDGDRAHLSHCHDYDATTTGFDVSGSEAHLHLCFSVAGGGASRGFYVSASGANKNLFTQCASTGNGTAGYEVATSASYNIFKDCSSAGADGDRVDGGTRTQWANFTDRLPSQNHELVYPSCDGEGTATSAITINNTETDATGSSSDRYYWGATKAIIQPGVLTGIWKLKGLHIFGTTAAKTQQGALYRVNYKGLATKNAGNDWDEGATVLTVTDATEAAKFSADDLVWVTSSAHTDGEIVKVVSVTDAAITIARETTSSARTGLRFNHTTDGTGEKLYLCYRASAPGMAKIEFNWSCASSRDFASERFNDIREMGANDGLVARGMNLTDDTDSEFDVTMIYEA